MVDADQQRLARGVDEMHALQLSKRGGELWCEQRGDRVLMKGKGVFYMKGEIFL